MESLILSTGTFLNVGNFLNDSPVRTNVIVTVINKLMLTRGTFFKKAVSPP